jgi:hypothetical protein
MKCQALMAMASMKTTVFWDVTLCGLVKTDILEVLVAGQLPLSWRLQSSLKH